MKNVAIIFCIFIREAMGGVPGEAADHHPGQHRPRDAGERLRPRPASQGSLQKKLWISRRHPSVQYSSGFTICSWLNFFDVEWAPECWMVRGSRSVWTEHWLARISSPSSPQREIPSMHINEEEKRNYKISSKWILYLICNVIFNSAVWFNYFSFAFHL